MWPNTKSSGCPMAKFTEEQLRQMPDYVIRYLAPMQCMNEVRAEAVRRYEPREGDDDARSD
jgi:hypothetical protein